MGKHWRHFWTGIIVALVFVGIIGALNYRLAGIDLLPDTGFAWYYWKLPERSFIPMFTAWSFYTAHQLFVWRLIWLGQHGDQAKRPTVRLGLYTVNILFIALHILQTHLWYDGLAQDVPVMSSQGSVIVMLVLILIMENDRRGLAFGLKLPGFKDVKAFVRKYHGYFIAWALVYTFWYHPTVATSGHLVGFFYMFLLFIQMSMIYTPVHMNIYWRGLLEVFVLFHGTTVAIQQQNNMWPMFMFGFGFLLVATQVYGFKLSVFWRTTVQVAYTIGVVIVFGGFTGHRVIGDLHQILWIPIVEYGLVFAILFGGKILILLLKKPLGVFKTVSK